MARMRELGEWRTVLGAAVLLVLAFFLFSLRAVLSPLVLFAVLVVLMTPYVGTRLHLLVVVLSGLLTFLWLLATTGFLLAPFILALVLSYILDPAVDALERRRIGRSWAIALLGLPVVIGLVLAVLFGIPALAAQVEELVSRLPALVDRVVGWAEELDGRLRRMDLPLVQDDALLERLRAIDPDRVVTFLETRWQEMVRQAWVAVLGMGRGIGAFLAILGYLVLTPVLVYYLLRDYDRITERLRSLIPDPKRERWVGFLAEYDRLLSRYLRGQLIAATTVGVLTGVGLWVLGFPYPAVVGIVAGVFNLVPYLGLIVSLVPAVLIALLSGSVLVSLLKVAVVFVAVQLLDSTVLGPRIVGGSVGLHPVWVILALAVAGSFFGFVGLLLAVPGAVLIKLLLREGLERYRRSTVFLGNETPEAPQAEAAGAGMALAPGGREGGREDP